MGIEKVAVLVFVAQGVLVLQGHAKIKHHIYTALSPKSSDTELLDPSVMSGVVYCVLCTRY